MASILMTSTTTVTKLDVDFGRLSSIIDCKLIGLDNILLKGELVFSSAAIKFFYEQLNKTFHGLTKEKDYSSFKENPFIPYAKLEYNNSIWWLDYQNEFDFNIGVLITLLKLVEKTIATDGLIFCFNKEKVSRHNSDNILAIIQKNPNLTKQEIFEQLNLLAMQFRSVIISGIEQIEESISFLIEKGFVDYNEKRYKVTAKGWLLIS